MIAVAVRGGLERATDGRREAVSTLKPFEARLACKGATQVMMVPESTHRATAAQNPKRSPERIIDSPRWLMDVHVHVSLSNRIEPVRDLRKSFTESVPTGH